VNIVIPMAGRGTRFRQADYKIPKPLIPILGQPMYAWAMKSLPLGLADQLIFLCLDEHLHDFSMEADIMERYGEHSATVIPVTEVTEGQACTVLLARKYINNANGLMIHNADTYFRSHLSEMVSGAGKDADGIISVFEATEERWSFVRTDEHGYVVEVAEKKPISRWATTGMYYFRHGEDFVSAAEEMIVRDMRVNNEFYIGPAYNLLIAHGKRIIPDFVDEMWCMGTPEDLQHFLTNYRGNAG